MDKAGKKSASELHFHSVLHYGVRHEYVLGISAQLFLDYSPE
jgi:hypothetical protein